MIREVNIVDIQVISLQPSQAGFNLGGQKGGIIIDDFFTAGEIMRPFGSDHQVWAVMMLDDFANQFFGVP